MKLIDLLVQELPKRGGWPEGIGKISMHANGIAYCDGSRWAGGLFGLTCSDGWHRQLPSTYTNAVSREQYEYALAASKKSEWNGEGLPPVGCECEWQDKNTQQWIKVSIVYASEWVTVIREDKIADPVEIAIENHGDEGRKKFRPVRSEQEVKREEVIDGIVRFYIGYHAYPKGAEEYLIVATALHCAIAAGKIPHIILK